MTGPSSDWHFLEDRRVVLDPARGVVALVRGTAADGAMLAAAHRMFLALGQLDLAAGRIVDDAVTRGLPVCATLQDELIAARQAAVMALVVAGEPTEH